MSDVLVLLDKDTMTPPDLPVCSFSVVGDGDLECGVVLLHYVAPFLRNWILQKFPIDANTDLGLMWTRHQRVQNLRSLPSHVAASVK